MKINKHSIKSAIVSLCLNALIVFNLEYTASSYYKESENAFFFNESFWLLFSILTVILFIYNKKASTFPSDIVNSMLIITVIYPTCYYLILSEVYSFSDFILPVSLLFVASFIFEFIAKFRVEKNKIRLVSFNQRQFEMALILAFFLCILMMYRYFASIFSLEWSSMYDRRFMARDIFAQHGLLRYINAIFGGLLIPFAAMYSAIVRKYLFLVLSILGGIICFGSFGGKGVLLNPYVAFMIGFYLKEKSFNYNYYFISLIMFIFFIVSTADLLFSDIGLLNWYVVRRIFYVPAELTIQYFEYFSTHDLYYMSDSILSFFVDTKQEYIKARLIGGVYYGNYEMNANVNMYATAFGDFGLIGIPLVAIFSGVIARFLNVIYLNKKSPLVLIYSLFVGLVWSQGGFHTSLLSNGVLVGLLIFSILPKFKSDLH